MHQGAPRHACHDRSCDSRCSRCSSDAPATPTAAECDAAVGELYARSVDSMHGVVDADPSMDPTVRAAMDTLIINTVPRIEAATARVCVADAWPPAMLDCMRWASADYDGCATRLSAAQRAHADAAVTAVMTAAASPN